MSTAPILSEPRRNPISADAQFRACFTKLLARAQRFCRNPSDANDLVQDTWERALRSSGPGAVFEERWLFAIMRNLWIDEWRRRQRQPLAPLAEETATAADAAPGVAFEARFELAVASLDSEVRHAFDMRFLQHRSYDEIARHLDVPKSTVGTRLLRARRQIHALVAAE